MSFDRFADELLSELDADDRRLATRLDALGETYEVPPDLRANVMAAVAIAAATDEAREAPAPAPATRRRRSLRWSLAGIGGLAAAAAAAVVLVVAGGGDRGPVEIDEALVADAGTGAGRVEVTMLGSGREVHYATSALPILPKGDLYELWFVGPGDTPQSPNRISAGTFHPDENGDTDVTMHAAVDPAVYPDVEITAEPGDGDPAPTGPVVARLDR